jgi:hypothetical protein
VPVEKAGVPRHVATNRRIAVETEPPEMSIRAAAPDPEDPAAPTAAAVDPDLECNARASLLGWRRLPACPEAY